MSEKKWQWQKIAESDSDIAFQANGMCVVEAFDKKITLAKYQAQLFAFAYKCPHAGGIMAEGFIDAQGNAVCPLHRYKFSMDKGRNVTGEGYYMKTYLVEKREDGIYVGMEEKGIFGWL